ncbi:sialic acid-binding Ig-like lectin 11 [Talpa occidentalis]|uniref:sialic acid-binding Ig-like lectin 11 n=1 Tax=Talpa occidentalis TaxID=50954 RepID=UPI0023F808B1|nr:sialic acid-binding Ig-like lectin 11 [Talpa occidentalis]
MLLLLLPLVWAGECVGAPARVPPGSPQGGAQPELRMQLPVTVQEGLCVLVPCTFSYRWGKQTDSSPVYGHWFRKGPPDVLVATSKPDQRVQKSSKLSFHLGDPAAGSCALNITRPRREDSGTYYFQVERGKIKHSYTRSGQLLNVTVTALTLTPDIALEEPLEAGRPSRLSCSDHSTELTCWVGRPWPAPCRACRARTLTLNVTYAPQNLTVRLFRGHCADAPYRPGILARTGGRGEVGSGEMAARGGQRGQSGALNPQGQPPHLASGEPPRAVLTGAAGGGGDVWCSPCAFHFLGSISSGSCDHAASEPGGHGAGVRSADQPVPAGAQGCRPQLERLSVLCPGAKSWAGTSLSSAPCAFYMALGERAGSCPSTSAAGVGRQGTPCPSESPPASMCSAARCPRLPHASGALFLPVSLCPPSLPEPKYLGNGSSFSVLEGESLRLLCAIDSNPPARLSWAWGRGAPSPSQPPSPGVLELPRVELGHEGEFTCHAQHPRGSLHISLQLSVQTPPQLLGPSCSPEDEGLLCLCAARAWPAPSLRWRLGERLLEGNSSNASVEVTFSPSGLWANSSLRLSGGLSTALRLSCEAGNPQGTRSATLLLLPRRADKPGLGREFVLGAVGGAGVAGLLTLCLGLVFFLVKTGKKAAAPSTPAPTAWGHQLECQPGGATDVPAPAPREAEEQELHYASLSFLSLRPQQPPDQDATSTTEYSEILTHK